MPNCATIEPLVTPYVDNELAAAERQIVDEHVRRCPPCRSRIAAEQVVHELIHERKPVLCRDHAPAILRGHCAAAARFNALATPTRGADDPERGGSARAGWIAWLAPMSPAASLIVIVGGAFFYQATARSSHLLAAQLAADHMKCF